LLGSQELAGDDVLDRVGIPEQGLGGERGVSQRQHEVRHEDEAEDAAFLVSRQRLGQDGVDDRPGLRRQPGCPDSGPDPLAQLPGQVLHGEQGPKGEFDVETPLATTHVHRYGPDSGEPVVLLHGAGFNASMWYPNVAALGQDHPARGSGGGRRPGRQRSRPGAGAPGQRRDSRLPCRCQQRAGHD
jgi:hypothetical protein